MGLLEELKEKRQDAIENVAAEDLDIEATNLQLAEHQRVRALWVQKIADIDRAIAALTPAPEAATGSDALAEFMKRDGAVKWEYNAKVAVPPPQVDCKKVEVLFGDGGRAVDYVDCFLWGGVWINRHNQIIAYCPIPSEPAPSEEGKGEGEVDAGDPGMFDDDPDFQPPAGYQHVVDAEPAADEPFSIAEVEAEEASQDLPPLLPPEAPKAITPEDMEARGLVDSEASWWARKMAKELA